MMFFGSGNRIKRKAAQDKGPEGLKFSRVLFYALFLIFAAVLIFVIFFSSYLEITNVYIQGTEELSDEKIKQSAWSFLGGKYFGVFPKKNLLMMGPGGMEKELEDDFKKISSVEVKKIFPNSIIVSVRERQALLIWCSGENCFLADEKGTAYAPADFGSSEVGENNLIIIHDQSRADVAMKQVIFKSEFGNFLVGFREKARDSLGIQVGSDFETPKAISGDFTGISEEGWKIDLNAEIGEEKEINMLKIVLDKNIPKEKRKDLEYVDLRTEGKVYYKFKSAAPEESESRKE